ncbi:MAG: NADH-quinone oxidoreductase subunit NuoE [Candidatus Hydrogenedentes bacterium]|nr:NADH-quinone oxidoreductase subunit NuoE [Candidatus Hydrogenedentota bacterium]
MLTAERTGREEAALTAVLGKYPHARREALIPMLQDAQQKLGYISPEAVRRIATHLRLPASKVYGVATFYNQFRFQPKGRYHVQVCRGTACHVKGSAAVLEVVQQELEAVPGETTRDGQFSVEVVACIGACGLAPLVCVNGGFSAEMSPKKVRNLLEEYKERGTVHEEA